LFRRSRSISLVLGAVVSGACAKAVPVVEVAGECGDFFQGKVCTWARMQGDSVLDIGADVPISSIENAPKDHPMTWPPTAVATLALPAAAQARTGLTQLTVYWEAGGHPPGAFLTPHFDFHFYTVAPAEKAAMDCVNRTRPAALAAGYALPDIPLPPPMAAMTGVDTLFGLCVPQMGMHSLLATELESTTPFRGSMVIGYYGGKPIFIEPMVTQTMLMEKAPFDLAIPTIPGLAGNYPRAFHAAFNPEQQSYRFVFSGFAAGTD
jgi:hypothetical protein